MTRQIWQIKTFDMIQGLSAAYTICSYLSCLVTIILHILKIYDDENKNVIEYVIVQNIIVMNEIVVQ